jgi:hypothetical protein
MKKVLLIALSTCMILSSNSMARGSINTDLVMITEDNINLEYEIYAAPYITVGLGGAFNWVSNTPSFGLNGYYNFSGTFAQGVKLGGGVYFPVSDDGLTMHAFGFLGYQITAEQFLITPAMAFGSGSLDFKLNVGMRI